MKKANKIKTPKNTSKTVGKPRVAKKLKVTKLKPMSKQASVKKPAITLNVPRTKEQQAGIPAVVSGNSFEGVRDISKLELSQQIDMVFNPLHTITKTTVTDAVSDSTFIVSPAPHTPEVSRANISTPVNIQANPVPQPATPASDTTQEAVLPEVVHEPAEI